MEIYDYNIVAGSNNQAPPNGAPENMQYGQVNDVIREIMASLARWLAGSFAATNPSAGTQPAYTLDSGFDIGAYAAGQMFAFVAHATSTGNVTLNVDTLGAAAVRFEDGNQLGSGDITLNGVYIVLRRASDFVLVSAISPHKARIADLAVSTAKIADDAVTYAKMQNVSATSRILGRRTAGAGDTEECTLTQILDFIGSATQGDILYRGSSSWARLAVGTLGEFLRSQGSGNDPEWAPAIEVDTVVSTASGTAVDFTGIPANAKRVTIVFDRVSFDGSDNIIVQIGDSGGIENTGYGSVSEFEGSVASATNGYVVRIANAARDFTGIMTLMNITGTTWISSHAGGDQNTQASSAVGGGRKSLSAALDRVRITRTGTNNFDLGQINVFWE